MVPQVSAVDSGGAGGARAPPEFGDSEKGQSLISAYQSLAITASTSGFEKLSTALQRKSLYKELYAYFCNMRSHVINQLIRI